MKENEKPELIEDDADTREEDLHDGSLYPCTRELDISEVEVDVSESPFSVFELKRQYEKDKLIINPEFQRNMVWKPGQMSWFIESILLNIPLPYLYLNQNNKGKYIVVDGLQRITTINKYLENRFSLQDLEALPWLNDKKFADLESELQSRIEDRKMPCYIIKPSAPLKTIYDIFRRINTKGTQLQRQEIRNCIYLGKATRMLKELSSKKEFEKAIDYGIAPKRMKDQEVVLRYIAFKLKDYRKDYKSDMDEFLGSVMKQINSELSDDEITGLEKDFLRVMKWTYRFFGDRNFRIPTASSRGRINIAVLESVGHFFSLKDDAFLKRHRRKIIGNFNMLIKKTTYLDSVKVSTGDRRRVRRRFRLASKILGDL